MKLPEIIPPADLLKQFEGVEEGLRQRRRLGSIGWIGLIVSAALQVIVPLANSDYFRALTESKWRDLIKDWWPYLLLLLVPILFLLIISWARFWLKESQEPFRYTCSIADFQPVVGDETHERLAWLSHDLSERLNQRIKRLRFKDEKDQKIDNAATSASHIHIRGFYGVRSDRQGVLSIEITPRIRIGSPTCPETLAHPVVLTLNPGIEGQCPKEVERERLNSLETRDYERIVERVYFSVATELYKQIQHDVEEKIDLLPRAYFRAVALFHEAEDYAGSNTLDAYAEAQKLYERAIHSFDPSLRPMSVFFVVRGVQYFMHWGTNLRRLAIRFFAHIRPRLGHVEVMCARAEIGYANMLLYRRALAGLSGHRLNPIYEARPVAERAVKRLQNLPEEVQGRRETLFKAYVTLALAWIQLGSQQRAEKALTRAERLDPARCNEDAQYLFVRGEGEPHMRAALHYYQRAVELEPRFELAQFAFAFRFEWLWRSRSNLERNVAEMVLDEYEQISRINPGNIALWAYSGYICWLLGEREDLERAREDFENGREYKAIKRATFVAELDYGLARIEAEQGDFKRAYNHYVSGVSAVIGQGASHSSASYADYYFLFINDALFDRFERYLDQVKRHYERWKDNDDQYHDNYVKAFQETVKQLKDLRAANDQTARNIPLEEKALKKMIGLLSIVSESLGRTDKGLREWVERQSDKQRLKRWILKGDLAHFVTQLEKVNGKEDHSTLEEAFRILLDPGFRALIESHLEAAATRRVRDSVLAFAYNDYGEACYHYYLYTGDKTKKEKAEEAYKNAIKHNSNYVIPHYNLYLFYTPKDCHPTDIIEAKRHLDIVCESEPNWPHVKLAQAEVKARLAMKASQEHEPEEIRKYVEEHGGADCLNQEAIKLIQQVLPHKWMWDRQKNGVSEFNWETLEPRFKYQIKWQKELDHLHVRALTVLGCMEVQKNKKLRPEAEKYKGLPRNIRKLFGHLQQNFLPADLNLHIWYRELLYTDEIKSLFNSPTYRDLVHNGQYMALIEDEKYLRHLQANKRMRLRLKMNYWRMNRDDRFYKMLREDSYGDVVLYHECCKIFRSNIERSVFELQAPFWALTWVVDDIAFADNVKPLFGNGDGFKRKEVILKLNRSDSFVVWLRERKKTALKGYQRTQDTKQIQLLVGLAESFEGLGLLDESLETYQQAKEFEATQEKRIYNAEEYHLKIASLLWAQDKRAEALNELKDLEEKTRNGGTSDGMRSLLSSLREKQTFHKGSPVLKAWLNDYRQRALEEDNKVLTNDVDQTLRVLA